MQVKIIKKEQTASVLDDIKLLAAQGAPEGTVVVAEQQTAGRGRQGRAFVSQPGGLYMALLLRPQGPAEESMPLTALLALAVCDTVEALTGLRPDAKWPNDILWNGRKLCGILTEGQLRSGGFSHIAAGIGLNVGQESFPPPVDGIAASLRQISGLNISLDTALTQLLQCIEAVLEHELRAEALARYRRACVNLGKLCRFQRGTEMAQGLAEDIDEQARLIVRLENGTREAVGAGEVHLLPGSSR